MYKFQGGYCSVNIISRGQIKAPLKKMHLKRQLILGKKRQQKSISNMLYLTIKFEFKTISSNLNPIQSV